MPVSKNSIRDDFPLLKTHPTLAYFDSACQSLRPQVVINALTDYYTHLSACSDRSAHSLARATKTAVDEARLTVARWLGTKPEEIIFTSGTTAAINLLAASLPFKSGDAILVSDKEHNSNLLPWLKLETTHSVKVIILPTVNGRLDPASLDKTLAANPDIKLVALSATSNIDGLTLPLSSISKIIARHHRLFFLDAAQSLAYQTLSVKNLNVDFLAFSGHKLFGPTGTGVLFVKDLPTNPYQLSSGLPGGGTIASLSGTHPQFFSGPAGFEAGLGNYAGLLGLASALNWLNSQDRPALKTHLHTLATHLRTELKTIPNLTLINEPAPDEFSSIVSFYIKDHDSHSLAIKLDTKFNLALRSGNFCNHYYFNQHRLPAALRVSLAPFNTQEEINLLVSSLKSLL